MSKNERWPFIKWFAGDWLADPKVSICEPATRGILFDWLCNMHLLDREGSITGTPDQLARYGRCSAVQAQDAIADLKRTGAADVTERNGLVTVTNRRMKRESLSRKNGAIRVERHRSCHAGNGSVTDHSQSPDSHIPIPKPDLTRPINPTPAAAFPSEPMDMMALDRVAGEIMSNQWRWYYDNCRVKITDFTRASLMTVLKPFAGKAAEKTVREAWKEAVRRAHSADVDEMVKKNPAAYTIACFRDLMQKA